MLKRLKDFAAILVLVSLTSLAMAGLALSEDWNSYSPAHSLGSGKGDWWIAYPDQNANSGSAVKHPAWVQDDLKENPLLILVHSSNCRPCLIMMPRMEKVVKSFAGDINYNDVLAEGSGYQKGLDILNVYNPIGGEKQYVPTTIFVTLIKDTDGSVKVAWHSVLDAISEEEINAYAKDAIYYYKQNAAGWQ